MYYNWIRNADISHPQNAYILNVLDCASIYFVLSHVTIYHVQFSQVLFQSPRLRPHSRTRSVHDIVEERFKPASIDGYKKCFNVAVTKRATLTLLTKAI